MFDSNFLKTLFYEILGFVKLIMTYINAKGAGPVIVEE